MPPGRDIHLDTVRALPVAWVVAVGLGAICDIPSQAIPASPLTNVKPAAGTRGYLYAGPEHAGVSGSHKDLQCTTPPTTASS